jgi:hypothetical protein
MRKLREIKRSSELEFQARSVSSLPLCRYSFQTRQHLALLALHTNPCVDLPVYYILSPPRTPLDWRWLDVPGHCYSILTSFPLT